MHSSPSAFHVTEGSTVDHQHFQPHTSHGGSLDTQAAAEQLPESAASGTAEQATFPQEPHTSSHHQHRLQSDRHRGSSQAAVSSGRNSSSRWQWLRSGWGPQQRRTSPANRSSRIRQQHRQDRVSELEVLHNIKAVVPHLSDEVILAELGCAMDANQAVENLLSRM